MRSNFCMGLLSGVALTMLLMLVQEHTHLHLSRFLIASKLSMTLSPRLSSQHHNRAVQDVNITIEHPVVSNKILKVPGLLVQESHNKQGERLYVA